VRRIAIVDRRSANTGWWLLLLQALLLIGLSDLVLYEPTVFVQVAAAVLAVLGIFSIGLAVRARRFGRMTSTYRFWSEWWSAEMPF
jgi:hypothetical protein